MDDSTRAERAAHLERRDPGLDGLRGYALIYIVLYHLALNYVPANPSSGVCRCCCRARGSESDLFFVLSGYLITGILLGVGREPGAMLSFYIRRGVRVFPLYYAMLFFFFVLVPQIEFFERWNDFWVPGREDTSTAWYWLYAANIKAAIEGTWSHQVLAVCWTLAIEEQFYLLWPWIVRGLGAKRLLWVCLGLLVLGPVFRMWMIAQHASPGAIYTFTLCRLDPLAVGSAIATLSFLRGDVDFLRRSSQWAIVVAAVVFVGVNVWTALVSGWTVASSMVHPLMQSFGYTAVAMVHGATLIMIVTDHGRGWFRRFFELSFLQMLGSTAIRSTCGISRSRSSWANSGSTTSDASSGTRPTSSHTASWSRRSRSRCRASPGS